MNKTDPTIESVVTPYSLTEQLRLLMRDRDIEIATIRAMGEMMSRGYLESRRDDILIHMIHETRRSVNDITATLILNTVTDNQDNTANTLDTSNGGISPLKIAIWEIQAIGRQHEIGILHRIAHDAMAILSKRYAESENE